MRAVYVRSHPVRRWRCLNQRTWSSPSAKRADETTARALSEKLFRPDGLFGRLATTEQGRQALVGSPLFAEAQRRLPELQRREGAEFARAVTPSRPLIPESALALQPVNTRAR